MSDEWRGAAPAPEPGTTAGVRRYSPREVIRVNLYTGNAFCTGIARASYEARDG
ncbi:hypothetical protein [Streptomyces sp. NPDC005141]